MWIKIALAIAVVIAVTVPALTGNHAGRKAALGYNAPTVPVGGFGGGGGNLVPLL